MACSHPRAPAQPVWAACAHSRQAGKGSKRCSVLVPGASICGRARRAAPAASHSGVHSGRWRPPSPPAPLCACVSMRPPVGRRKRQLRCSKPAPLASPSATGQLPTQRHQQLRSAVVRPLSPNREATLPSGTTAVRASAQGQQWRPKRRARTASTPGAAPASSPPSRRTALSCLCKWSRMTRAPLA